jgi:hypothetical protein
MTQDDLVHLSGFTVAGPVWVTCDRWGGTECLGPGGGDVLVSDLALWARDHVCPGPRSRMPAREAVA